MPSPRRPLPRTCSSWSAFASAIRASSLYAMLSFFCEFTNEFATIKRTGGKSLRDIRSPVIQCAGPCNDGLYPGHVKMTTGHQSAIRQDLLSAVGGCRNRTARALRTETSAGCRRLPSLTTSPRAGCSRCTTSGCGCRGGSNTPSSRQASTCWSLGHAAPAASFPVTARWWG